MIVEWFLELCNGVGRWFISLFGDAEPPEWLAGAAGWIGELIARSSGLGAWFPFVFFGGVAGSLFALWFVLWLVKLIRWGWGLFTGGT